MSTLHTITPPSFLSPLGQEEFYKLDYKYQCYIVYRYELGHPHKYIMKIMFIKSRKTIYHIRDNSIDRLITYLGKNTQGLHNTIDMKEGKLMYKI